MIVIRLLLELGIALLIIQYFIYFWALADGKLTKRQFWYGIIPFGFIFFFIGYMWDNYKNLE